ncbi:MAG: hypothetical protein Q7R48_02780 [bacterium]|nr:hypothetical protein [bacterium]
MAVQVGADLKERMAAAEAKARETGHELGEWRTTSSEGKVLYTSACQHESCRADTFLDVEGGEPRGTATWGGIATQCPKR